MKAIILAAGRGTRLGQLTDKKPKCLLKIGETNILNIQINQFIENNIKQIFVVSGHCSDQIQSSKITKINNDEYASTNMVYSLIKARKYLDDDIIISYGDIIYDQRILRGLILDSNKDLIVSDKNWKDYWIERYNSYEFDIESFRTTDGKIIEIGQKCNSADNIDGRYIGLMKFSKATVQKILQIWDRDFKEYSNKFWKTTKKYIQESFMTDMVQVLINEGVVLKVYEINNQWCEIDTQKDYQIAQKFYSKNIKNCHEQ